MKPDDVNPPDPAPRAPALRLRAFVVVGACMAVNLGMVFAFFGDRLGLSDGAQTVLLGVCLLLGGGIILFGMEPFRREELREQLGQEPAPLTWRLGLFIVVPLVPTVLLWHYLLGDPWRAALARAAGFIGYLAVFVLLARVQRRGVKPYWRPAGYGFLLAGSTGGLVWAQVADASPVDGVIKGVIYSAMHYAYARWTTRGAATRAAGWEAASDAPPRSP